MAENIYVAITHKITITVTEIQGRCFAGLKVGDKIVIRAPIIDVRESDNICMNAFSAMMPYIRQWLMEPFPLTARVDVCCPDPGPEKGGRGHVGFSY